MHVGQDAGSVTPFLLPPLGFSRLIALRARVEGGKLGWGQVGVGRILVDTVSAWAKNTGWGTATENSFIYWAGRKDIYTPGWWPGSLVQGLCGYVPLARTGVLEDTSSTYTRTVHEGPYKVKQGVKLDI